VYEAEEAEADGWYHYPSGRVYYTRLRAHMKEVVDALIDEAVAEGFVSTRKRPGPKCAAPAIALTAPWVLPVLDASPVLSQACARIDAARPCGA
jgi:hypothetical protein